MCEHQCAVADRSQLAPGNAHRPEALALSPKQREVRIYHRQLLGKSRISSHLDKEATAAGSALDILQEPFGRQHAAETLLLRPAIRHRARAEELQAQFPTGRY